MFKGIQGWWQRGRKYPGEGWLTTAREEVSHTPDTLDIENRSLVHLFLPCELQTGHPNNSLIPPERGVRLFIGFTKREFSLYRNREDNSAIFLEEPKNVVKGELWAMHPSHISVLDKYKENGVVSDRRRIDIRIPFTRFVKRNRTVKGQSEFADLTAWAYIDPMKVWNNELDDGYQYPPIRLFRPNNPFLKPFYYYRPDETKQ